jgi:hypothetical protein
VARTGLGELWRRLRQRPGRLLWAPERHRCAGSRPGRRCYSAQGWHIGADAVVTADDGFPGNVELFCKFIGPQPDLVLMRYAGTAIGDVLKMT